MARLEPGRHRLALLLAVLASALTLPAQTTLAQCTALRDGDFEQQHSRTVGKPWIADDRAGMAIRRRLSRSGANNAWARSSSGWNAIRQTVTLRAGTTYTLSGWVRTSASVSDGYFGFRGANQRPVSEIRYGFVPGYRQLRVTFRPTKGGRYYVFAGVWALGRDTWIQSTTCGSTIAPATRPGSQPADNPRRGCVVLLAYRARRTTHPARDRGGAPGSSRGTSSRRSGERHLSSIRWP